MSQKLLRNSQNVAKILLELGCLKISTKDPFTYSSGLKGPLYCDNRLLISYVEERRFVIKALKDLFQARFDETNWIAALATAGIPHGCWLAEEMSLPMIYIRSSKKSHGKGSIIEGAPNQDATYILLEDLINQGSSAKNALEELKKAKLRALGMISIVDYKFESAKKVCDEFGIEKCSLTNLDTIIDVAIEMELISPEDKEVIKSWQKDPINWESSKK